MKELPRRPRLRHFDYLGTYAYLITIATHGRKSYFSDRNTVQLILPVLEQTVRDKYFLLYAYCFMPDHLHVLLRGNDSKADLKKCITAFKQKSGFLFKRERGTKLWQPSFHEHVLRKEEDLLDVARYVFLNPVRKGLVDHFKEYPFSGSLVWDIEKL